MHEGYLRLRNDGACGTPDGGVVVDDGATLEGDSSYKSGGLQFTDEPLTFVGFGVNGEGAVKMIESSTWNFFYRGKKTMTGDALWNGKGRLDVRFGDFDMGGHTLYASNSVCFVSANVINPGRIVGVAGSQSIESAMELNTAGTNEFVFAGSTDLTLSDASGDKLDWKLVLSNSVTVGIRNNAGAARTNITKAVTLNRWTGPVWIGEGSTLSTVCANWVSETTPGEDPFHHLFNLIGKVSGPGAIRSLTTGGRYGYLRVMNPDNDFSGGVKVSNGSILEAISVASLGTGPVTVSDGGQLIFLNGSEWDTNVLDSAECGRILALKDQFYRGKGYTYTTSMISFPTLGDGTYEEALDGSIDIFHHEDNTLTLSGTITGSPKILNSAGTLAIAGPGANELGRIFIPGGTVRIADGTSCFLGENTWLASGAYPSLPRLVVGENAVLGSRDEAGTTALPLHVIGGGSTGPDGRLANAEFSRGILEILSGAIVTNQFCVGGGKNGDYYKTNDMGAVYLRGGTIVQHGNNSKDTVNIGYHADGYVEIDGGVYDAMKGSEWILVGSRATGLANPPGYGVMHVKDGLLSHRSTGFGVNSGGGYGHLRVSGGMVSNSTLIVGKSLWTNPSGGEGVVTVEGGVLNVQDKINLGGISNSVSILNLNGGVVETPSILGITNRCMTSGGVSYPLDYSNANNPTYVNFNGGTYRSTSGNSWSGWMSPLITRHTIYAGGVTMDTGSYNRELQVPIKAPTGNGVKAVDFACAEPWRYIGAPYVRIVDPSGSGSGASACADFDSVDGVITGVTVMSPGCDYGPDTYAEIRFGGWTNTVRATVTLEANEPCGDFAKTGSGTLYQRATNECGGVVRIVEGQLCLSAPDVFPYAKGFHVAEGAKVFKDDYDLPAGTLSGTGTITCDYTISGTLTVDAADLIAGRHLTCGGAITIAEGTKLVVLNPELLSDDMKRAMILTATRGITGSLTFDQPGFGPEWRVSVSGNSLRFGPARGLSVIVR